MEGVMNIKVLPLPSRLLHMSVLQLAYGGAIKVPPVFFRDGLYKVGNICWFELKGRAFKYDVEDFNHTLLASNVKEISCDVMQKLSYILKNYSRILTKQQIELVHAYHFNCAAKDIDKNISLRVLKYNKGVGVTS